MGDRKFLVRYLQSYKDCVHCLLLGEVLPLIETSPQTIFDKELPELNMQRLREPCLHLPEGFLSKQRKMIHEVCTELGLYHISVGRNKIDRFISVSVYYDGFDSLTDYGKNHEQESDKEAQAMAVLSTLKPWALRRHSSEHLIDPVAATKVGREAIFRFIDQPGECLRDGIDFLDFQAMESEDLSSTTPPSFRSEDWTLVDTPDKMEQCVNELQQSGTTEIAFDLECYNKSKYLQVTCLLQLAANNGKEYVIDPLAPGVWDSVSLLAPLFANPEIVKIGHSIGGLDVRSLHRDFGIFVVNAFDTYEAARCLNLPSKGLAKVCAHYGLPNCNIYEALKEKYQTSDWTRRPLTEPMIRYGRYDVHYLIQLRKLMMRDLAKSQLWEKEKQDNEAQLVRNSIAAMLRNYNEDDETFLDTEKDVLEDDVSSYHAEIGHETEGEDEEQDFLFDAGKLRMNLELMQVISRSQDRCLDLWTDSDEPALKNSEFQALLVQCKSKGSDWTLAQMQLYEALAKWRKDVAVTLQCSADFVCSLGFLAMVAMKRPTSTRSLRQINFHLPATLETNKSVVEELFILVRKSRIKDCLEEMEDLSLFPSYTQAHLLFILRNHGVLNEAEQNLQWSSTRIGLASCLVVVILYSILRNGRPRN